MTPDTSDPDEQKALALERHIAIKVRTADSLRATFGVLAGTAFVAYVFPRVLEYCGRVHWILGALFSTAIVLSIIGLIRAARQPTFLSSTRSVGAGSLSLGLFVAVVVAGWVSYTLHSTGTGSYAVGPTPSVDVFMRLYFYTLADLVPALKITETLHLKSPVEARDFAAGCPVLAFRAFVLWFLFDTFKNWHKSRKEEGKEKPGDILLFVGLLIIFVTVVASMK